MIASRVPIKIIFPKLYIKYIFKFSFKININSGKSLILKHLFDPLKPMLKIPYEST